MISSPICLYDCDVPADGATAIVVSAAETGPDLRAPVRIEAMAGVVESRPSWEQWEDMGRVGYGAGAAMWARTDLRPGDVDVAQLYDGFTIEAVWWLEAMGFCGTGEAGAFVDGGTRIALGGELPLNTWGGQLSGGRLHAAFGHTAEAVRQLRIGLAALGTVVDTTEEAWDRALDVNLRTAFLASKYAVPVMAAGGGGAIVNVASISALRGDGTVAYSAAKGGMIAMTVDMAYSHGRQGIRVNAVAPGHITTPMVMSVSAPGARAEFMNAMRSEAGLLGTPGTGWDVGWAATFLASDEARWITGVTLPVESGVLSVTPLMMAPYLRAVPDPGE